MTDQEFIQLAAMLVDFDLKELKSREQIAINDRDFEKLKKIYEIQEAVQAILEAIQ